MTPTIIIFTVVLGLVGSFFFWLLSPTLDRVRDWFRERTSSAAMSPEIEAELLKQLRWQEISLKKLEKLRADPKNALLYVMRLVGGGLMFFVMAAFLYALQFQLGPICILPATMSFAFFFISIIEGGNLTDEKLDKSISKRRQSIDVARAKLKL